MKIKLIDRRNPDDVATTEYEVELTADLRNNFQFKAGIEFPTPALGRSFFLDGRELNVSELNMEVEDGKAMFYFMAEFIS